MRILKVRFYICGLSIFGLFKIKFFDGIGNKGFQVCRVFHSIFSNNTVDKKFGRTLEEDCDVFVKILIRVGQGEELKKLGVSQEVKSWE
jgi:hypothetical protein